MLPRHLQHLDHLQPTPNMTSGNIRTIDQEKIGAHLRERLVRQTDVVEDAVDVERGDVVYHVEGVRDVCGVEDEVERVRPGLLPVGFGGDDEVLCAAFERVFFFVRRVRESVDFGAEGAGELEAEMSEATAMIRIM